ncbi:MAG: adenine phosphoribosyltransferase [Candidatus Margulisbacteria bacterium]|nr:adenine phosphoribosyltransferase [Candidatus Margulisiibacteriota bacterium]
MNLLDYVRDIQDFPKKGIVFKDITPLIKDSDAFKHSIELLENKLQDIDFDYIVAVESRGFIFGAALALQMGKGIIPVRKKGKLPAETISIQYDLEYGTDSLELHKDALMKTDKVIIIDDLLATGGTVSAVEKLIAQTGAEIVADVFVVNLAFLNGIKKLSAKKVIQLLEF